MLMVCHAGVMTGHSTALSVGQTQHLRAAALLGMAEIQIQPWEIKMGQMGNFARAGMAKTLHGKLRMGLWV